MDASSDRLSTIITSFASLDSVRMEDEVLGKKLAYPYHKFINNEFFHIHLKLGREYYLPILKQSDPCRERKLKTQALVVKK